MVKCVMEVEMVLACSEENYGVCHCIWKNHSRSDVGKERGHGTRDQGRKMITAALGQECSMVA